MVDRVIRVLVVDDSAYIRKVVGQMLSRSPFIEVVGTARNGVEALEKVEELQPDVLTLDLMMPEMDGIAFLQAQMARRPLPVVVVSIASESSAQVLAAFEAGAVDVVQKPTALATEKVLEIGEELIASVKAAALVGLRRPTPPAAPSESAPTPRPQAAAAFDIVLLGISTGGPQGLKWVIPRLSAGFALPIAVVLHIPIGYTALYAQSLDALSQLHVFEARSGEPVRPGTVLLAPAGYHLTFTRLRDNTVVTRLDTRPLDTPHRPSVDVLFQSAAEVYRDRVLGVVMTGMGSDGRNGAAWIKAQGGTIWTEAEESCVVYGMPRAVDEAGLSDRSLPLSLLAQALQELA
jgi:two-component system chemotaxis response regulator CheB